MATIYKLLEMLQRDEQHSVLATIIRVEGSSYRKEGTSMLFQGNSGQIGFLSGGCLEQDLAIRAEEVLMSGRSNTVIYDMSAEDDLSWGQGSGCNGRIHVLLEPVEPWMREQLMRLQLCLERGISVVSARKFNKDNGTEWICFLGSSGEMFGNMPESGLLRGRMEKLVQTEWAHSNNRAQVASLAEASFYIQVYYPRRRLIIFGAGPDVNPLVQIAAFSGFTVTLCDWRGELCCKERFPNKLALPFGQLPLGAVALAKALNSRLDRVIIVTNSEAVPTWLVESKLHFPNFSKCQFAACPDAASGISRSIRVGIHEALAVSAQAAMILLADQPFITTEMINSIISAFNRMREARPDIQYAASAFRSSTCPPVIFSQEAFPELLRLEGDQGAKQVLGRMSGAALEFRDRTLFYDIDNKAQYEALLMVR